MRIQKWRKAKKTLAKCLVFVLAATSLSVGGTMLPQNTIVVQAAAQWDSTAVYVQGDEVEYNGATYQAQWWTQGDQPGTGDANPWKLVSGGSNTGEGSGTGTGESGSTGSTLEGSPATETFNPEVGTNAQGVVLPATYYNKKVVGYFPNYAIDSEAHEYFSIADLQWDKLTHVQYAFGVVNKDTFALEAGDVENDIENKFEDREFYHDGQEIKMDESLGYYGQFNLMHTLKKMHPDVTVLISTGGWGASEGLWYATQNEDTMRAFCESAVAFIRKYDFDGIDIDFEFPSETPLSGNYTDFTEANRSGIATRYAQFIKMLSEYLGKASKEDGKYYWLTSAVSASSWVLGGQTDSSFLDYLDFVSIMSYDYHGGWNNYVENQANIYPDPADTETAQVEVKTLGFEWSYRYYRGKVQSEKILMGVPYYTRGWTNVSGGTNGLHGSSGTPLTNATDNLNIWYDLDSNGQETPAGANPLWHVMNVMKENPNYQRYWDDVGKVPHIWNSQNNTFLTFEDTQSVQERINYVEDNNLGGVLIWVMHGDYDYDETQDKYVIGDTLTSMFYEQFEEAGASKVTTDIDYTNQTLDFSVDFGGKYDHPNYTYSIKVTNNSNVAFPAGFTFSFDLPKSSSFTSSWGETYTTDTAKRKDFTEVTITSSKALQPGETTEFTGMMKCCFSAAKNFKINGLSMLSEVNEEIKRLNSACLTTVNGSERQPEVESGTTEEETKPGTTTEEETKPGTTTEEETKPGTTTEEETKPGTTTEEETKPGTTTEEETKPGTTTEEETKPGTTTEEEAKPGTTTENKINNPITSEDKTEPVSTTGDNSNHPAISEDETNKPAASGESGSTTNGTSTAEGENVDDRFQVGTSFTKGKLVYKITKSSAETVEVQVVKPVKKTYRSVSIPKTVKYQGKQCVITAIAPNAFKGNKKLKSVTIGKNVTIIGKKAFYNCKCLKKVTFKKNDLKSIGAKAFSKTNNDLQIKTGAKKLVKKYSRLLKKKIPEGAKIKK